MALTFVSDRGGLLQALKSAQSGDTILLAPGVYSGVTITNLKIAGGVTISSNDPGSPAVFTDLSIKNSSGLTFSSIEFDASNATASNPFKVLSSSHIHFDRLNVHGSLDGDAGNDTSAMQIRDSSVVSVKNSEFQQLSNGLSHLDSEHLTISGNSFHDIRIDGVRGGGSSHVTISGNHFTDFYRNAGDHPDAIQFWTSNTTASAHDIIIADNVIARGDGEPMQGIFLKDESGGSVPYLNVKITGNVLVGSMWNGISVNGADGLEISDNVVGGFADMKARIALKNATDVILTNNEATDFIRQGVVEVSFEVGNTKIAVPTDGGNELLGKWAALHVGSPAAALLTGVSSLPGWGFEDHVSQPPAPIYTPITGPENPVSLLFDYRWEGSLF